MNRIFVKRILLCTGILILGSFLFAQTSFRLKYSNSLVYAGIEVGSKGVKLSILEIGKNAQTSGAFNILKDTSINTDFITFSPATSHATLNALYSLYTTAVNDYKIPTSQVFTVISSGVKIQADKQDINHSMKKLIDSFKLKTKDPVRQVAVVDVIDEARLSHLGIVPDAKRYSTFLIDIGSGNTKGGYFPFGNTKDFKLFQLTWGTKSTANAVEKRVEGDKSISNFNKELYRVLSGTPNSEIIYAVNESGSYPLSDNISFSGGIAWAVATLMYPEQTDNPLIPVTFDDVTKFSERLISDYASLSDSAVVKNIRNDRVDKAAVAKAVKTVNQVFDQRSMMAGTGLLLKIMRQFESIYEKKHFLLIKNGQVGWISAYVDQNITK